MSFSFLFTSDGGESLLSLQLSTGLGFDFSLPVNSPPEPIFTSAYVQPPVRLRSCPHRNIFRWKR